MDSATQDWKPRMFSIKLWPPSDSTHLMLVDRRTNKLSMNSIFSKRYGLLGKEEAYKNAKRIEEECFSSVDEHFKQEPDGDGSSAVQLYAKETSKMMLEVLKRGPRTAVEPEVPVADAPREPPDTVFTYLVASVLIPGDEGATSIAEMVNRSPNIESFRCSATRIGSDGGVALAEALGACTCLKKLDLRDNLFGVDAGMALSKTLAKLPDLIEIYLSDLNLEN